MNCSCRLRCLTHRQWLLFWREAPGRSLALSLSLHGSRHALQDSEGGVGLSRLARGSSAQAEPLPDGLEAACVHDRHELTGAWISTGGQLSPRRMASHGGSAVQEEAEQQQ